MINLVKNELYKIFKRKSIFVVIILMFLFSIFVNVINLSTNETNSSRSYEKKLLTELKEELKIHKTDEIEYYDILSEIETIELSLKYKPGSWQSYVINTEVKGYIIPINEYKFLKKTNELKEAQKEYNEMIDILDNKTWKDYAVYSRSKFEKELAIEEKKLSNTTSKYEKENIILNINELKKEINKVNIRLEKNIIYKDDYINDSLLRYNDNFPTLDEYIEIEKKQSERSYNEAEVRKNYVTDRTQNEKDKYIIETKKDLESSKTLRDSIMQLPYVQSIFIIIITIMISGSIVSTEFDKGTIKLLLIRPYSRFKILLSKFISCMIVIIISIVFAFLIQFITGAIFHGFTDLDVPVIAYNLVEDKVLYINVFKYTLDTILAMVPQLVLLSTLAFSLSTIINNSVVGVGLPIMGYVVSEIINTIINSFDIKILKYFVTVHWDLNNYLYGGPKLYNKFTIYSSIVICLVYFIIMVIPTFIVFIKKNIKNI